MNDILMKLYEAIRGQQPRHIQRDPKQYLPLTDTPWGNGITYKTTDIPADEHSSGGFKSESLWKREMPFPMNRIGGSVSNDAERMRRLVEGTPTNYPEENAGTQDLYLLEQLLNKIPKSTLYSLFGSELDKELNMVQMGGVIDQKEQHGEEMRYMPREGWDHGDAQFYGFGRKM